jgi:hypothetical protein
MQRFNSPELEDHEWWNLKRGLDCEDPESEEESSGEGVDSDGEPYGEDDDSDYEDARDSDD